MGAPLGQFLPQLSGVTPRQLTPEQKQALLTMVREHQARQQVLQPAFQDPI